MTQSQKQFYKGPIEVVYVDPKIAGSDTNPLIPVYERPIMDQATSDAIRQAQRSDQLPRKDTGNKIMPAIGRILVYWGCRLLYPCGSGSVLRPQEWRISPLLRSAIPCDYEARRALFAQFPPPTWVDNRCSLRAELAQLLFHRKSVDQSQQSPANLHEPPPPRKFDVVYGEGGIPFESLPGYAAAREKIKRSKQASPD